MKRILTYATGFASRRTFNLELLHYISATQHRIDFGIVQKASAAVIELDESSIYPVRLEATEVRGCDASTDINERNCGHSPPTQGAPLHRAGQGYLSFLMLPAQLSMLPAISARFCQVASLSSWISNLSDNLQKLR